MAQVTKKHSHYGHSPNKRLWNIFLWPRYIGYNDKILGKENGIKFGGKLNFFDIGTWGTSFEPLGTWWQQIKNMVGL